MSDCSILTFRIDTVGKSKFYYSDSHDNKSRSYALTNLSLEYQTY